MLMMRHFIYERFRLVDEKICRNDDGSVQLEVSVLDEHNGIKVISSQTIYSENSVIGLNAGLKI